MPQSSQDVSDDLDARLVVLSVDHPYGKESGSAAEVAAKDFLESRGKTPRLYRNSLVFLAADKTRLQDLDEAARKYLAWTSIIEEKLSLNLDPQQVKQAEAQLKAADGAVTARLPETYMWLLVPTQATPQSAIEWQATRLTGQDALAVRASKKLRSDELLLTGFAATRLRMELDRVPLWRGDSVSVKQLAEDFGRYLYLPRLADSSVLVNSVRNGLSLMTWEQDSFAFADSYDDIAARFRGLRTGEMVSIADAQSSGLLVKPGVARAQLDADRKTAATGPGETGEQGAATGDARAAGPGQEFDGRVPVQQVAAKPKRFHGTATLNSARVGRDASRIADEVIAHLAGLVGAEVKVTIEIDAMIPSGAPDNVVRTVTENSRTLKFTSQGFEEE
jgi:hypothetical protein